MGSGIAPKYFPRSAPFGQSTGQAVTQVQPLAQAPNQITPALSGYQTQRISDQNDPASQDNSGLGGGAGDIQDLRNNFLNSRNRPFYGRMF